MKGFKNHGGVKRKTDRYANHSGGNWLEEGSLWKEYLMQAQVGPGQIKQGERERRISAKGNSMFKWAEEYGSGVEVKAIQYGVQSKKRYERRPL